jgi:site-specific DNA-methyltransferase (adenine-specific)
VKPYYQDDLVKLYHGDCLEVTEWTQADVLVTDPPYGIEHNTRETYGGKMNGKGAVRDKNAIANDQDTKARDEVLRLWGPKPFIMFGAWKIQRPEPIDSLLVWHKAGMPPGPTNAAFMTQHEEIYVHGSGFRKSAPPLRSVITTKEHRPTAVQDAGHPTPKPIGLMETLIDRCIQGVIAEPFAGSGSTLIAARNLGKKAIGVELHERYCEQIATRLSQQAFDLEGITA